MKNPSQKRLLLVVLLVGLCAVAYYQYQRLSGGGATPAEAARAAFKETDAKDLPAVVAVPLDEGKKVQIRKDSRNLFNYSKSPSEVKEDERVRREQERLAREAETRRQQQQEAELAARRNRDAELAKNPPPPTPPPIPFRFIGKMGEPRAPIAVLVDMGSQDVFTAREGELIGDTYKVQKIDFDSVTIGYAEALFVAHPTWAAETRVIKMGS